jgi:hypothetical protein
MNRPSPEMDGDAWVPPFAGSSSEGRPDSQPGKILGATNWARGQSRSREVTTAGLL